MKAILVIDVNDDTNFDEALADITMQEDRFGCLKGKVGKKWHKGVKLKPIPKKIITDDEMFEYDTGYNACIDEILGDENEDS